MVLDATQVSQGPGPGQGSGSPSSTQEAQSSGGGSAGQPTTQQQSSRPPPPASGSGTGQAGGTGTAAETGTTEQPRERPDLSGYSHEEILDAHPTLKRYVDSRVGDLSQRQARELAEAIVNERLEQEQDSKRLRERMEYRRQLRRDNPEEFAKYDEEQERQWETEQSATQRASARVSKQFFTGFDNMLFEIQFSLPEAAQNEVAGKTFRDPTGDPFKSRQLYLKALTDAAIKHGVNGHLGSALTKAREDITQAARLEANGQARGGQPALNTQSGDAPSTEYVSQSEFDQFGRGHSSEARAWRKENKTRIDAALAAGRINQ